MFLQSLFVITLAIGKLVDASFFRSSGISPPVVKLLSKVGDDIVGQRIIDELNASNVETSSQLFHRGVASTSSFTTVIVDEKENTRTCIHTPGTCGELSLGDVESLSQQEIDQIFRNVVHLHSDARHTDVSLWMAKEAKRRGIKVSCDCEKDRKTKALDELIEVCDILFTNSNYLREYLARLSYEKELVTGRQPLSNPTITVKQDGRTSQASPLNGQQMSREKHLIDTYVKSLSPSIYFSRWQDQSAIGKEVVVTHGSMGALHFKQIKSSKNSNTSGGDESKNVIDIEFKDKNTVHIRHSFDDGVESFDNLYEVYETGILKDVKVVDTTGAGDAFIGGYILISTVQLEDRELKAIGSKVQFALETGSFVGGRKVEGPGARTTLPTGMDFDHLGSRIVDVKSSLQTLLGAFNDVKE